MAVTGKKLFFGQAQGRIVIRQLSTRFEVSNGYLKAQMRAGARRLTTMIHEAAAIPTQQIGSRGSEEGIAAHEAPGTQRVIATIVPE